jgi:hypothetical protein
MKTANLKHNLLLACISISFITIGVSCTTTNPRNIPTPPNMVVKNPESSITTKSTARQNNRYEPLTTIEEGRNNGGIVTQIKVNNRGDIPDYYIYPTQQYNLNINNPQRNMVPPTWQLNW